MQRTTQIMTLSRERQELLDQLAQTVEYFRSTTDNTTFTYAIKAAINGEVVDVINDLRTTVEAQCMSILGVAYTNTTYLPFNFIVKQPTPQFNSIKGIQEYYTNKIALLIQAMTLENVDTKFVDDGIMGQGTTDASNPNDPVPVGNTPNNVYNKGTTWTDGVAEIIVDLGVINAALMGEVPNVS